METQHVVGQAAAFAELTGTFLVGQTRFRNGSLLLCSDVLGLVRMGAV